MSNKGMLCTVHCSFSLVDGTFVDDTRRRNEPLQFVCDEGGTIPGIVAAVEKMNIGDTIEMTLAAPEAFGEYQEDYVSVLPVSSVPNGGQLPIGKYVYLEDDGNLVPAKVVAIENNMVTLDYNHPMAGKELNFSVELISVEEYIPQAE